MRQRLTGGLIGVVFGLMLSWSAMANPAVVRNALLFRDSYLYLLMASAVGTAALGLAIVERRTGRAAAPEKPTRRHIVGALIFGLGWGFTGVCPGPVAADIGQGVPWAVPMLAGALIGVYLYVRRSLPETEPAAEVERAAAVGHRSTAAR